MPGIDASGINLKYPIAASELTVADFNTPAGGRPLETGTATGFFELSQNAIVQVFPAP